MDSFWRELGVACDDLYARVSSAQGRRCVDEWFARWSDRGGGEDVVPRRLRRRDYWKADTVGFGEDVEEVDEEVERIRGLGQDAWVEAMEAFGGGQVELLDMFEALDVEGRGEVDVEGVYVMLCLLAARECRAGATFVRRSGVALFEALGGEGEVELEAESVVWVGKLYGVDTAHVEYVLKEEGVLGGHAVSAEVFVGVLSRVFEEVDGWEQGTQQEADEMDQESGAVCGRCVIL